MSAYRGGGNVLAVAAASIIEQRAAFSAAHLNS